MGKFSNLLKGDVPVLVDFYADWCDPCKVMNPILDKVAKKVQGKAKIVKVNVDKNKLAATNYGVRGVPTLILFKNGKQIWRQSGVVQEKELISIINKMI